MEYWFKSLPLFDKIAGSTQASEKCCVCWIWPFRNALNCVVYAVRVCCKKKGFRMVEFNSYSIENVSLMAILPFFYPLNTLKHTLRWHTRTHTTLTYRHRLHAFSTWGALSKWQSQLQQQHNSHTVHRQARNWSSHPWLCSDIFLSETPFTYVTITTNQKII